MLDWKKLAAETSRRDLRAAYLHNAELQANAKWPKEAPYQEALERLQLPTAFSRLVLPFLVR